MRNFVLLFIILPNLYGVGCKEIEEPRLKKKVYSIQLRLDIEEVRNQLVVRITNISSTTVRLWHLHNSWGWFSLDVLVKNESQNKKYVLSRKERDWTKNGPTYMVLFPKDTYEVILDLKDDWWDIPSGLKKLEDMPLSVQVRYSVDPTPEATEYGVFTGTVVSDPIRSLPPHLWLLA